jgi:pyruvate,water dikinase
MRLTRQPLGPVVLDERDPIRGNSDPDTFWSTANLAEAAPSVMMPLDWSLWGPGNELGVLPCWYRFGMLGPDEVHVDRDQSKRLTGVFYGRHAMNVDVIRERIDRFPGITADEFELGLGGSVHEDPRPFTPLTETQRALVADAVDRARTTHPQRLAEMVENQDEWWKAEVLRRNEIGDPVARMAESFDRFCWSIGVHNETRLLSLAAYTAIYRIAGEVDSVDLVPAVTSAFGDVAELAMAADLWSLARSELDMEAFLERHGFHGDCEGNPAGRSWREESSLLSSTIAALRRADPQQHPDRRAKRAIERQREALTQLESRMDAGKVTELRQALVEVAVSLRELELGKAAFLRAIDGFRAAARDLGSQLVHERRLTDAEDVFLFTLDELRLDRGASVSDDVLEHRRERVVEYRGYNVPTTFRGMPEPIVLGAEGAERVAVGDVLTGVGGSAGSYEGAVRIIRTPEDEDALQPGDVLCCETTDPSWTPLFMLVEAVVIDVGAAGSHGAIIARELGMPAVLNTVDGSRRLRSGDRVLVDGTAGTVTVLALVTNE